MSHMRGLLRHRRVSVAMRPLVVIAVYLCAWAMFPPPFATRAPAPTEAKSFLGAARRAIAHGQIADAESLARGRPGQDPSAAAVLAQLAMRRGKYDEAAAILEPVAAREADGEAALT